MGSSDTDANALAVMPCTSPSRSTVIMVTPVAKYPMAFRNSLEFRLISRVYRACGNASLPQDNRLHYHAPPLYDSRQRGTHFDRFDPSGLRGRATSPARFGNSPNLARCRAQLDSLFRE